jgi:peptidyl-prolyl cis-trans isomerase B (cyclophilin B)
VKRGLFLCVLLIASCGKKEPNKTPPDDDVSSGPNPIVLVDTSLGEFKIELYQSKAPITVKNFLGYVDDKFYDGTIFHRVISDFMIQGGGMLPGMREKRTKAPIKNEAYNNVSNRRGTVAMARTDNPDSASAQFFVNVRDNTFLDRDPAKKSAGYAVFGKVIEGMDVVDQIREVKTRQPGDVPIVDVVIKSIRRVETKEKEKEAKETKETK